MRFLYCQTSGVAERRALPGAGLPARPAERVTANASILNNAGIDQPNDFLKYFDNNGKIKDISGFEEFLKAKGWTAAAITTMFAQNGTQYYFFNESFKSKNDLTIADFQEFITSQIVRYARANPGAAADKPWYKFDSYNIVPTVNETALRTALLNTDQTKIPTEIKKQYCLLDDSNNVIGIKENCADYLLVALIKNKGEEYYNSKFSGAAGNAYRVFKTPEDWGVFLAGLLPARAAGDIIGGIEVNNDEEGTGTTRGLNESLDLESLDPETAAELSAGKKLLTEYKEILDPAKQSSYQRYSKAENEAKNAIAKAEADDATTEDQQKALQAQLIFEQAELAMQKEIAKKIADRGYTIEEVKNILAAVCVNPYEIDNMEKVIELYFSVMSADERFNQTQVEADIAAVEAKIPDTYLNQYGQEKTDVVQSLRYGLYAKLFEYNPTTESLNNYIDALERYLPADYSESGQSRAEILSKAKAQGQVWIKDRQVAIEFDKYNQAWQKLYGENGQPIENNYTIENVRAFEAAAKNLQAVISAIDQRYKTENMNNIQVLAEESLADLPVMYADVYVYRMFNVVDGQYVIDPDGVNEADINKLKEIINSSSFERDKSYGDETTYGRHYDSLLTVAEQELNKKSAGETADKKTPIRVAGEDEAEAARRRAREDGEAVALQRAVHKENIENFLSVYNAFAGVGSLTAAELKQPVDNFLDFINSQACSSAVLNEKLSDEKSIAEHIHIRLMDIIEWHSVDNSIADSTTYLPKILAGFNKLKEQDSTWNLDNIAQLLTIHYKTPVTVSAEGRLVNNAGQATEQQRVETRASSGTARSQPLSSWSRPATSPWGNVTVSGLDNGNGLNGRLKVVKRDGTALGEFPMGDWVGSSGRRFTYTDGQEYVLSYANGWKIEALAAGQPGTAASSAPAAGGRTNSGTPVVSDAPQKYAAGSDLFALGGTQYRLSGAIIYWNDLGTRNYGTSYYKWLGNNKVRYERPGHADNGKEYNIVNGQLVLVQNITTGRASTEDIPTGL